MSVDRFTLEKPYPTRLKILEIGGTVLFPKGLLPLVLTDPHHIRIVEASLKRRRLLGVIQRRPDGLGHGLYGTGCLARIVMFTEASPQKIIVFLAGIARFSLVVDDTLGDDEKRVTYRPYQEAQDDDVVQNHLPVDRDILLNLLKTYTDMQGLEVDFDDLQSLSVERLLTIIATVCPFDSHEKQALLETPTVTERCHMLMALMEMAYLKESGLSFKH